MKTLLSLTLATFLLLPVRGSTSELHDAQSVRKHFGLDAYEVSSRRLEKLKIAVLDNGFGDFQNGDSRLPPSAVLVSRYSGISNGNPLSPSSHGLYVAQTIWATTGGNAQGPEFHLLNSNGFTHFKAAIQYVLDQEIDIVVYSQNWEFGGQFDGRGFINAQVSRAVDAGVIWINSAGNYGGLVHNSPVRPHQDGWLVYKNTQQHDRIAFKNLYDRNDIRITLSWSDFTDSELDRATRDLDLFVYNSKGEQVASGTRAQVSVDGQDREPSQYAREQFSVRLPRGEYSIRIRDLSGNFDTTDQFRLTINGGTADGGIDFTDRTSGSEIMPPADHPGVITVGDLSARSASGPTTDGRMKPDVLLQLSEVRFTDGFVSAGTTYAAAYFSGIVAVLKTEKPSLTRDQIMAWTQKMNGPCLTALSLADSGIAEGILSTLEQASGRKRSEYQAARTQNGRTVILMNQDPWTLSPLYDFLLARCEKENLNPESYETFITHSPATRIPVQTFYRARGAAVPLPGGDARWIELRATRLSAPICGWSPVWRTPTPEELD